MKELIQKTKDFLDKDFLKLFLVYLATLFFFFGVAYFLFAGSLIYKIDFSIQESIFSLRGDGLTDFMKFVTNFGDKIIVFPLTFFIILYLFFKRKYDFLLALVSSAFVSAATVYLTKLLFARERPADALIFVDGFSFPSGHAMVAIAFYGILTYFAYTSSKYAFERYLSVFVGLSVIILVSFSRLYLGVHFPSDVFFSIIFSGVWLLMVIYKVEIQKHK